MSDAERETGAISCWERTGWLASVLGLTGDALPVIRETVSNEIENHGLKNGDRPSPVVASRICSKLIKQSAMKVGAVGGITAAPAALPIVGTLGIAVVGTTVDFAYLIRKQVELCYSISAVYDTSIDEEELKAIVLALLGFSGAGQIAKEIAASTLRSIVDATASRFIKKGLTEAAADVAVKLTPKLLGRSYKLIPFLSIPLSVSINIASTMMLGNQARKYFSFNWQSEC
ncbi:MAG: hypothetical protein JRI52_11115 [Deltaproteobacteria bacterium]|jgi:hypothetical protein|nr:hypothetical protein [Deltaproteobacteria bacterium]